MVEADPIQNRTFAPKKDQLDGLFNKLKVEIDTDKHLNADLATTELDQYFTCTICLQVVEEPKECQDCN